ncbi:MAG: hypothetical protein AABW91_00935 [Nanoarchaeota archaeon]
MKSSRDDYQTGEKYEGINRREFFGYAGKSLAGLALASGIGYSPEAYANQIYYINTEDNDLNKSKTPAYIVYNNVSAASKYQPGKDDSDRVAKIAKRDANIRTSVTAVAAAGNYDIVVEKGDPVIKGYKDINPEVIETLKAIERNQ